jgi:hypothetical protein
MRKEESSEDHLDALIVRFRRTVHREKDLGCVANGLGGCTGCYFLFGLVFALVMSPYLIERALSSIEGFLYTLQTDEPTQICLAGAAIATAMYLRKRTTSARIRRMTAELAASDDLRTISPLLVARELKDRTTRRVATDALKRLLPKIGPEHGGLLGASDLELLHYVLYVNDEELILATLRALKHIGNRNSLWYVEGWAGNSMLSKDGNARIQETAKEAMGHINERLERQKAGRTLLRPVDGADGRVETLLRPATAGEGQPQDRLLRPTLTEQD